MPKTSQAKSGAPLKIDLDAWDSAISRAQEIIDRHEAVVIRLKQSIKLFEEFGTRLFLS